MLFSRERQRRPKRPVPLSSEQVQISEEAISFVVLRLHTHLQERFLRNARMMMPAFSVLGSQMCRGGAVVGLDDVGSIIIDLIREGRCLLTNTYQVRPYYVEPYRRLAAICAYIFFCSKVVDCVSVNRSFYPFRRIVVVLRKCSLDWNFRNIRNNRASCRSHPASPDLKSPTPYVELLTSPTAVCLPTILFLSPSPNPAILEDVVQ